MTEMNTNMDSPEWKYLIKLLDTEDPSYEELVKAMFNIGLIDNLEYVDHIEEFKKYKREHPDV